MDLGRWLVTIGDWWSLVDVINRRGNCAVGLWWWLIVVDFGRWLVPVSDWRRLVHIVNRRSSCTVSLWRWLIIYLRGLWDSAFCGNVTGTS